jgi:K+-sensing histidine kinase KdpD
MDAFEILVVILSITLAVFLTLGIISMVIIIRVAKRADRISEKAEYMVNNLESASQQFKKAAVPAAVLSGFAKFFRK